METFGRCLPLESGKFCTLFYTFAIRKPAVAVFTLDDYAAAGIMTSTQAVVLRRAVAERRNILVAGGTSTGKTTLTNALLAEVAKTADRVVLIEDTRELQCQAPNLVALRTKDGVVSLSDLVRSSLRLRPDRIPIGEVRGAEALDLLKAWGTGHPGGIGTIHAGTGIGALRRLEQLIQEAVITVPRALIAETINVVAGLSGGSRNSSRSPGWDRPATTQFHQQETSHDPPTVSHPPAYRHRRRDRLRDTDQRPRLGRRLEHAVGATAQPDPWRSRRARPWLPARMGGESAPLPWRCHPSLGALAGRTIPRRANGAERRNGREASRSTHAEGRAIRWVAPA